MKSEWIIDNLLNDDEWAPKVKFDRETATSYKHDHYYIDKIRDLIISQPPTLDNHSALEWFDDTMGHYRFLEFLTWYNDKEGKSELH